MSYQFLRVTLLRVKIFLGISCSITHRTMTYVRLWTRIRSS